jgi:hypothetical protein
MFVASDAPKYVRGITACAVLYIVEFCGFGAWRTYCKMLRPVSTVRMVTDISLTQIFGRTEDAPVPFGIKAYPRRRAIDRGS